MSPQRSAGDALLGDVVAFTALPALWIGQPLVEVARSLAEALERALLADAIAIVMRADQGLVEARAGDAHLLDDDVDAWRATEPRNTGAVRVDIGPLGARGVIFALNARAPKDKLLLARLAANLADNALREAALHHQAVASRQQLTRMEKLSALGQLVSGVAHELRTPLTYANNNLYLARMRLGRATGMPDAERESLAAMLAEVLSAHERIERTVGTLRHLSNPHVGQRGELAFSDAVAEATRLFAITHVGPVTIERKLEARGHVRADRVEIQQVVLNLLQNAAEAAPRGCRIVVSTADTPDAVALVVEDDGPGIPAAVRERLFDPFVTTKPSGTGLGLSIVRRIVESHGARILVADAAKGGARFEVVFPRAVATSVPVFGALASPPRS